MQPENNRKYFHIHKMTALLIVVVLAAVLFGWWLGHSKSSSSTQQNTSTGTSTVSDTSGVTSLVSYTLPDGWKEASCAASPGSVFIIPAGSSGVDCNASPSAPIKLSVDPTNSKDCNDLQHVQDVKKHTCISLYINGHKSLKSSTEYLASSSYKTDTTINAYYIDTGKGVVKAEYTYTSDNQFQAGFDQLARSIKVKG